jgi:hypothetical protein
MLAQFLIGSVLIIATTLIHGLATMTAISWLRSHYKQIEIPASSIHDTLVVATFVLWLFLASIAEVWLWAGVYLVLGAFSTLEEALYFSTVTFSTLGYGDVVLDKSWRLLGSFEAANGLFLFGWSTALVFTVVQKLHILRTESNLDKP